MTAGVCDLCGAPLGDDDPTVRLVRPWAVAFAHHEIPPDRLPAGEHARELQNCRGQLAIAVQICVEAQCERDQALAKAERLQHLLRQVVLLLDAGALHFIQDDDETRTITERWREAGRA